MKKTRIMLSIVLMFLMTSCSSDSDGNITAINILETGTYNNLGAVTITDFGNDEEEELLFLASNSPEPNTGDPTGFFFDLTATGAISDGYNDDINDAFDDASEFTILTEDTFNAETNFPYRAENDTDQAYLEDVDGDGNADQLVLLATTDGGLEVVRKIYVFPSYDCQGDATACGVARYLDCVTNPTMSSADIDIQIESDLGSDDDGVNEGTADTTDSLAFPYYFATSDPGEDTSVGYVIGGPSAPGVPVLAEYDPEDDEDFSFNWGTATISPSQRSCFMHYVILGNTEEDNEAGDNDASDILQLARNVYASNPRVGILASEDADIRNFDQAKDFQVIVGEDDSVPGDTRVTVTNTDSNVSTTALSTADGAFTAYLHCDAGDSIEVTASDFSKSFDC
ncbi:hypothetical protein MRY82_09840 [bacterium]|nr:hypothetical protein [bacterium]